MSPGGQQTGTVRGPFGPGWRVLSKFQVFMLWFGGFYLGVNLAMIGWGLDDGRPMTRMLAPILGVVVAVGLTLQALWWLRR